MPSNLLTAKALCVTAKDLRAKGFTLVELVVFIAIISLSLAGVLGALNYMNGHSADPLARKQALAIAESLLQEVLQMPYTYCDPDDDNAALATSEADCATPQNSVAGPVPNNESRYDAANPLDNVTDYAGFSMPGGACVGICRVGDAVPVAGLNGYQANVNMAFVGGAGQFVGIPVNDAVQVTVTVTGPANTRIALTGFKLRYAPRV